MVPQKRFTVRLAIVRKLYIANEIDILIECLFSHSTSHGMHVLEN